MSYEVKSLNEEYGILGVWGHPDAASVTYFGLHSLRHRGQEGAGIASSDRGKLKGHQDLGLLSEVFRDQRKLQQLTGEAIIGHVRYAIAGNGGVDNIQPFLFEFRNQLIGLVYNGNLINVRSLRKELGENGTISHSSSDTEMLARLIRRDEETNFLNELENALNGVKSGFACLLMTETAMIAALDPNGFRPLTIGQMKNGAYVIASETCTLEVIGVRFIRDIQPSEMVITSDEGIQIDCFTKDTQLSICSMEYIYFAKLDSSIAGINVHTARKNMERDSAKESPVKVDIVVDIPNSSLSVVSGYAEASGVPYEIGLVKNQYIVRTFIQPTPELREQGVRMKSSAVRGVVEGKKMVMVDSSVVRGTTSRRIVHLLKKARAREVHVRIASPPLKCPCFCGIDIQARKEPIAASYTIDEIKGCINTDSLGFSSEEDLIESIGLEKDAPYSGLCTAYFNGDYSTPLYDCEEKYQESLKERISFF